MLKSQDSTEEHPKVIFLLERSPSERDGQRFGIWNFQTAGYRVQFWNLEPLLTEIEVNHGGDETVGTHVRHFNSRVELCKALLQLRSRDTCVCLVGIDGSEAFTFRWLHKMFAKTAAGFTAMSAARTLSAGLDPPTSQVRLRLRDRLHHTLLTDASPRLGTLRHFMRLVLRLRPLDFLWLGTEVSNVNRLLVASTTRISILHSLDYDLVLRERHLSTREENVAILLDTMGPLHPDFVTRNETYFAQSPESYFANLRAQLLRLSLSLGLPIEVAAHPRCPAGAFDEHYAPFVIHYQNTCHHIARAKVVIVTSGTTALGMAVALAKPILVALDSQWPHEVTSPAHMFAEITGAQTWQTDKDSPPSSVRNLSPSGAQRFIDAFVKYPDSPDTPFWEFVAEDLRRRLPGQN